MAARVERIKQPSRTEPDAPATIEFTRPEIDTMILLRHQQMPRKKPPYQPGDTPTMAEMTLYIADMGGYMGARYRSRAASSGWRSPSKRCCPSAISGREKCVETPGEKRVRIVRRCTAIVPFFVFSQWWVKPRSDISDGLACAGRHACRGPLSGRGEAW